MVPKVKDKTKFMESHWCEVLTSPSEGLVIWGTPVRLKAAGLTEEVGAIAVSAFDLHHAGAHGASWGPCQSLHLQQQIKVCAVDVPPFVHRSLFIYCSQAYEVLYLVSTNLRLRI